MLIGISGKQRSGKDTVAEYLINKYGFKKRNFADPLKIMAAVEFHISPELLMAKPDNVRKCLQLLGQAGRAFNPDFWVDQVLDDYQPDQKLVIADVRFKNEADKIKKAGGILVRVMSDRKVRQSRGVLSNEDDVSEVDLDDYVGFDYFINNNSSLENLYKQINHFMMEALRK